MMGQADRLKTQGRVAAAVQRQSTGRPPLTLEKSVLSSGLQLIG